MENTNSRHFVIAGASIDDVTRLITSQRTSVSRLFWKRTHVTSSFLIQHSIDRNEKNRAWYLSHFSLMILAYLTAFRNIKKKDYYSAWRHLEQAEINVSDLKHNAFIPRLDENVFNIGIIISSWQKTFPYKWFASPEMRILDWSCSICGARSTPIRPCGHLKGIVYDGELCFQRVEKFEFLGAALVTNPVQKFSVIFPEGLDYDYSLVDFAIRMIKQPFLLWEGEWMYLRHSHTIFSATAINEKCPCFSGLKYAECCLKEPGVLMAHFEITQPGADHLGSRVIEFVN